MRILMIGSNSFIGNNFKKYSNFKEIDEISLISNRPESIDYSGYQIVLHLAAIVHQKHRIPYSEYEKVNVELPVKIAKLAMKSGVKQFIFLSTVSVYGLHPAYREAINEFTICNPKNDYGKSKLAAELELRKLNTSDFTVSIIRSPMVYGEDIKANLLSLVKLVNKFPVLPFANIDNLRSFVAAENLVEYIDRIMVYNAGGLFIACDQIPISTSKLVALIASNLEKKIRLCRMPEFVIKAGIYLEINTFISLYGSFILENNYTIKRLNFAPRVTIEEGIKKMIEKYRKKGT
jgi:UDP-glucose 4-epimerase